MGDKSVADLIAQLKLDISDYEAGISDVKGVTRQYKQDTQSVMNTAKMAWTEVNSAISVAKEVIGAVNRVLDQTVGEYVRYADQVEAMHRLSGMSYEDASRLIQASDDLFVSQQTLMSAMEFAIRQGYQPSVIWLQTVADQIRAIPDPSQRAQMAIKLFGKQAGPEMLKLLEQGSDGIQKYMDAIDESLVMTAEGRQKALEYKQAMDEWSDATLAFKMAITDNFIGPLTAVVRWMTTWYESAQANGGVWQRLIPIYGPVRDIILGIKAAFQVAKTPIDDVTEAADGNATALEDAAAQAQALSSEYSAIIGLTQNLYTTTQTYKDKLAELKLEQQNYTREIDILETKRWLTPEQRNELAELKGKLYDTTLAIRQTEDQYTKSSLKIVWDLLQAKLATDGLSDADFDMLMDTGVAFGIFNQTTADTAKTINNLTNKVIAGTTPMEEFTSDIEELLGLPGNKSFQVDSTYNEYHNRYYKNYGDPSDEDPGYTPQAEGGDWLVTEPTMFLAGEAGPERATFTPLGPGMGGGDQQGGLVIHLDYHPTLSMASSDELEGVLGPIVERYNRKRSTG